MKKNWIIFILLMCAGVFAMGQTISNGNFESWEANGKPTSWTTIDSGIDVSQETNASYVFEGNSSAKVVVKTKSQGSTDFRQSITLPAGEHTFSTRLYYTQGHLDAKFYINGSYISASSTSTTGEWQEMTKTINLTRETNLLVGFRFYDKSGFSNRETLYIDDFKIVGAIIPPSVSIAPNTEQNIYLNDAANMLTATETPQEETFVSREWGYRTTSGGDITYLGVSTSTYTPATNATGIKYYVCKSNFTNNNSAISNEVKVNVFESESLPYNQDFSNFNDSGINTNGNWNSVSGSNAGGASPELKIGYSGSSAGNCIVLPAINTNGKTELTLTWKQKLVFYQQNYFTTKVLTSTDGENFNQAYSYNCDETVTSSPEITLNVSNGVGSKTFYVKFELSYIGSRSFTGWYLDDINLTAVENNNNDTNSFIQTLAFTMGLPVNANNNIDNQVTILSLNAVDLGTSDNLPTKITKIKLVNSATENIANWQQSIAKFTLWSEDNEINVQSCDIYEDYAELNINSGDFVIADGANKNFKVKMYLKQNGLTDNTVIKAKIDSNNHGCTADISGSGLNSTFNAINSEEFTVQVKAKKIIFTVMPSDVEATKVVTPAVVAKLVDNFNNVDVDTDGRQDYKITLTANGNVFTNNSTTNAVPVNGVATFNNLAFQNVANNVTITAKNIGHNITSLASDSFNVTEVYERPKLFISEIADPKDNSSARFIELFNASDNTIDFDSMQENDWKIKVFANGKTNPTINSSLTGILPAYTAYLIGSDANMQSIYGVSSNLDKNIGINGDDTVALYKGDALIDVYGAVGTDGSGKNWEYADSRSVRKRNIAEANNTFTASEWKIYFKIPGEKYQYTHNMTPKSHGGESGSNKHNDANVDAGAETEIPGVTEKSKVKVKNNNGNRIKIGVTAYENQQAIAPKNGFSAVNQWWEIEADDQAANIDLVLYYDETLLGGIAESDLTIWHYNNGVWEDLGGVVNIVENYIALAGYDGGFSPFTLGNSQSLPVELSSFSASLTANNFVSLDWKVQSESNMAGYYVYKNTSESFETSQCLTLVGIPALNQTYEHSYSFVDEEVEEAKYYYWLKAFEYDQTFTVHGPIAIAVSFDGDDDNNDVQPAILPNCLIGNSPNPFNPETKIEFSVASTCNVEINIFNIKGQKVKTFTKHALANTKQHVIWKGKDSNNNSVSSGVYFYQMKAKNYTEFKKMIMLK